MFSIAAVLLALALPALALADDWDERTSTSSTDGPGTTSGGARSDSNRTDTSKYDFTLPYIEGEGTLSFKELAESGQPFVLVWWLSDCPVCHLQLPYVEKLEKLVEDGKADVRIVSINIDDGDDSAKKYVKDKGVSFEVLHDDHGRRTESTFKVKDFGTPMTWVFKPGGELVDYMSGWTAEFPSKVLKMLDLPVPEEAQNK